MTRACSLSQYVSSVGLALGLAFAASAPAQERVPPAAAQAPATIALPAGVQRIVNVEGITEYRLANGLRVLLFPDASKPTVTVNVTYLVGSRHENYGETGMAHLLEHLMFKGTPKFKSIDQEFNKRGMRSNGSTWLDRTNYFELFQAGDDNLKWALAMEADRMTHSFIARKDLDSEMTVVRNEYEQGENSPFSVLTKRMQSIAFDWHSYGRSTIGNRSDIENVRIDNLQAFYRQYYQPDNAVLLVAGRFDDARVLQWIAQDFGVIPRPKRVLPVFWTVEPVQDGERSFVVRRKGDIQIVVAAYKVPSGLRDEADALSFANFILTDTPTGRLHKALVDTGKASQVVGLPLLGVYPGLHLIGAVVKNGEPVEPVREEMLKVIENFWQHPPTAEEMERARQSQANDYEKTLNDHESIGVQMSEYISLGDWKLFFHSRDRLDQVTAEDVARLAQGYYRRDNRTVGVFLPEDNPQRAEMPPTPTAAQMLKDFKPRAATSQSEAFDPSPANIDKRTKVLQIGGLKVALLQKRNRGETVNVSLRLNYGDAQALFGKRTIASLTGQMLTRGNARYTRGQIADAFDKLKVSGGVSGSGARFETTKPNLAAALRLTAQVLREPSFPADEFEQLKKQAVTGLEAQRNEPSARAGEVLSKHFNTYPKGDWRYAPGIDESIADTNAVTLDDLKKFHQTFYGASYGEVAVVGEFDEAEVVKALTEAFGTWKSQAPFERIATQFKDIPPVDESVPTPDKENAVFYARLNIDMRDDDADYPALFVADYILGGGAGLNSRFAERIRQKEGLSYGVGSQLSVGSIDRAGAWQVYAIAAPQNIAKVQAAYREELARALKDGFTPAEIASAKSGALQQLMQDRAQDANLAGGWTRYLYLGRTFAWSQAFEDRVNALKPQDVVAALRKHIDPAKVSFVKAGDFSKAPTAAAK